MNIPRPIDQFLNNQELQMLAKVDMLTIFHDTTAQIRANVASKNFNTDHWESFTCRRTMDMQPLVRLLLTPQYFCAHPQWFSPVGLNDTLKQSIMRVGSAFMQMMFICVCDIDMGGNIFWCIFTNRLNSRAEWALQSWLATCVGEEQS